MNRNQFTELCHPKNSQPLPTYSAWTFYKSFFEWAARDKKKKKKSIMCAHLAKGFPFNEFHMSMYLTAKGSVILV